MRRSVKRESGGHPPPAPPVGINSEDDHGGNPNASEKDLRHVAIRRKNWLFAGSRSGRRTTATLFSIIGTCPRDWVEPMSYLYEILTRIAVMPINQRGTNLPNPWQPATAD